MKDADFLALAQALIEACAIRGVSLATAESCTGGLVGASLTAVPGASRVYLGGVVSYANAVKQGVLGVPEAVLAQEGAVSAPCARAMALGAQRALGARLALATTGIAGPGSDGTDKPVGLVYAAAALDGAAVVEKHLFAGDRESVRAQTVRAVLDLALRCLEQKVSN